MRGQSSKPVRFVHGPRPAPVTISPIDNPDRVEGFGRLAAWGCSIVGGAIMGAAIAIELIDRFGGHVAP